MPLQGHQIIPRRQIIFTVGAATHVNSPVKPGDDKKGVRRNRLVGRARRNGVHPALDDFDARGGRGEELDQRLAGIRLFRGARD